MNLTEVKQLLTEVAAIDNRKLNDQTADAWQSVLRDIPLEIAKEALHLARRDDRITWMEPKHIYSWAKDAAIRLDRTKPIVIENITGSRQPLCKAHSALLLSCIPCCKELHRNQPVEVTESILELQ